MLQYISKYSSKRKQLVSDAHSSYSSPFSQMPFEITTGGAIIFVLDVDRFEKI